MQILTREIIEATAKIMGENSAAAMVLEEAKGYDNPIFIKIDDILAVTDYRTLEDFKKSKL